MEPKFSVFASFFLCMIMFSVMFTPVNGVKIKFSLAAISDFVRDTMKYYQVTLFSLQILLKCCNFFPLVIGGSLLS